MKHVRLCIILVAAALPASLEAAPGHFSVAVTGGTLGIGPEASYRLSDTFGFRANATFLNISKDFKSDDIGYAGRVRLRSFGAMLDLYPFGGHFRISAGARINNNDARAQATPTTSTEVGDAVYTPAQIGTLTGTADVRKFAPAATIGWSGSNRRGFMLGTEVGALFQGRVRINRFTSSGTLQSNTAFQADAERERVSLQKDVDDYKVYPIVQVMVGYRF